MPLIIVRADITKMQVDAIVNAANSSLLGGGGVDGAIHRAAGGELLAECMTLGGCKCGEAKLTGGYNLPAKHVIHTVGPIYKDGHSGEEELLRSCYRSSLKLADDAECESVAFPLISSGIYGYPKDKALKVATEEISAFLEGHDMTVYIAVFDRPSFMVGAELFSNIAEYIDDNYVDTHTQYRRTASLSRSAPPVACGGIDDVEELASFSMPPDAPVAAERKPPIVKAASRPAARPKAATSEEELKEKLKRLDESFTEMLLRKIDERGMTDAECYKRANVDRKLFSKIRSNAHYRPSKPTALAFAIALELTLEETEDMLRKAGFALSHSNKFDVIVEYFISNKRYNIFEINAALFAFDQCLLG